MRFLLLILSWQLGCSSISSFPQRQKVVEGRVTEIRGDFTGDKKTNIAKVINQDGKVVIEIKSAQAYYRKAFNISLTDKNSFCYEDVSLELENPDLPLEEWKCLERAKDCQELKKADYRMRWHIKQGMRGIVASDGACDSFHFYYNPSKKKFEYWRN